MRKCVLSCALAVFLSSFSAMAQESVTISTYYPAPMGIFNQLLVTNRMAVGDVNGDGVVNDLDLARDAAGNAINGALTVATSLGIGTVSPQGELHIRSTDNNNGNANIILEGENPANGASTGSWNIFSAGGTPGVSPAGNLNFVSTTSAGATSTPMTIEQGAPNDSLYVASNGNIGLGTNNPRTRLDVQGGIQVGDANFACNAQTRGVMRFRADELQVCTASGWGGIGGSFGGCYSSYLGWGCGWPLGWCVNNPYTHGQSCPAGYHAQQILAYPYSYVLPTHCCYK